MGIVRNFHGLMIARLFLGITEAGLYPGCAVCALTTLSKLSGANPTFSTTLPCGTVAMKYNFVKYGQCIRRQSLLSDGVTCYYQMLTLCQAMFFSAASIAGAFSGLLAFAIAKMDGIGNLEGWRWIFILEGLVTVSKGPMVNTTT